MEHKISLDEEFDRVWNKFKKQENFVLLRYGDGERAIMCGRKVVAQEGWQSTDYISRLGEALLSTLNLDNEKVFYGISCPCCDVSAYLWYMTRIRSKNITFSNFWANANYKKFKEKFPTLERDAILIANYRAKNRKIGSLNILRHYEVSDDCVGFWETDAKQMIDQIKKDFGHRNDLLYVVAAGPMSEPIIVDLYKNNPNNCYIDFGSAIDTFVHNKQTRPYMDKMNDYAKRVCWMYDPKVANFDVSVILTAYKKPQNLRLQLDALKNQSIKPKEILLFQDGIDRDYKILFNDELLNSFDGVKVCDKNHGVWERFDFARKNAKSQYVCVFDDDTIPGSRWLENCLMQMHKEEGLYGTIGVVFDEMDKYPYDKSFRVGWDGNLDYTARVDLVGHSWFLKREWLDYLFDDTKKYQNFKIVGEDITLSYKLKQKGINTFVPPHPKDQQELWGSLNEYAVKLGVDSNAISMNPQNIQKMNIFIQEIIKDGFITLKQENIKYYFKLRRDIKKKINIEFLQKIFSIRNSFDKKHKIIRVIGAEFKVKKMKYRS